MDQETGRSPSTHVPFLIANPHLEPSPFIFSKLELPFRWDKNHPQRSPGCIYLFIYNLMFRIFFLGRKKKLITSLKEGNRKSQHYDADAGQARQPGTVSYLITV